MEPSANEDNPPHGQPPSRGRLPRVSAWGITEIWPGELGAEIIADIVLVHGLMGHPLNTWVHGKIGEEQGTAKAERPAKKDGSLSRFFRGNKTSREPSPAPTKESKTSGCYWPFDLLPKAFPAARVMTYGYDSHPTHFYRGATNRVTITQHAEDLMNKLALNRSHCKGRPIIFIAHSLGGILVKGALNEARLLQSQPQCLDVWESCFAVVFMGTPHLGANIAEGLSPDSETLYSIARRFNELLVTGQMRICSIQEGLGTSGIKGAGSKVVPDYSSALNRPELEQKLFNQTASHMSMCKFSGEDDQAWIELSQVLSTYGYLIRNRTQEQTTRQPFASTELAKALNFDTRYLRKQQLDQLESVRESFDWIWSSPFADWLTTDEPLFWIAGRPASGKSTIVNYVTRDNRLEQLLPDGTIVVKFFFDFRGGKGIENNLEGLRRSLLLDLLPSLPELQADAERRFGDELEYSSRSAQNYLNVAEFFAYVLETNECTLLLFLDGLDEFDGRKDDLLRLIEQIGRHSVRICLSSRPDPPFSLAYEHLKFTFRMHELNRAGIEAYARDTLSLLCTEPAGVETNAIDEAAAFIAKSSSGMFLWARFAVDEVFMQTSQGIDNSETLLSVLDRMPRELEDVYERILDRLKGKDRRICYILLELVDAAARPLEVSELLQAAFCSGISFTTSFDDLDQDSIQRFRRYLQYVTGGLVESVSAKHDRKSRCDVVHARVLHRSVQTYLDRGGWDKLHPGHRGIASGHRRWIDVICDLKPTSGRDASRAEVRSVQRLNSSALSGCGPVKETAKLDQTSSSSPVITRYWKSLHEYAHVHLPHHARNFEQMTGESSWPLIRHLLDRDFIDDHVDLCLVSQNDCDCVRFEYEEYLLSRDIHFAIWHELIHYVESSLEQDKAPNVDACSALDLPAFRDARADKSASLLATAVWSCFSRSSALKCQIVDLLIPLSTRLTDDEMFLAIQTAPVKMVKSLLSMYPQGRLRFRLSSEIKRDDHEWPYLGSAGEYGPLWALGKRFKRMAALRETTELLDCFLSRGEDINRGCGPLGTVIHSTVIAATADTLRARLFRAQHLSLKRALQVSIDRGADINAPGPQGNALEYVWMRANTIKSRLHTRAINVLLSLGAVNHKKDPNGIVPDRQRMSKFSTMESETLLAEKYFYVHGQYPPKETLAALQSKDDIKAFENELASDLQVLLYRRERGHD